MQSDETSTQVTGCGATNVTWTNQAGRLRCSGPLPSATDMTIATATAPPGVDDRGGGSAQFRCRLGTPAGFGASQGWVPLNFNDNGDMGAGICAAYTQCGGGPVSWTDAGGANHCSGTIIQDLLGAVDGVSSTTSGLSGQASFLCVTPGNWVQQGAATCAPNICTPNPDPSSYTTNGLCRHDNCTTALRDSCGTVVGFTACTDDSGFCPSASAPVTCGTCAGGVPSVSCTDGSTRAPDTAGNAYWIGQMNSGLNQASVLVSFTNAAASIGAFNAVPGTGWLVKFSATGGYADKASESAAAALQRAPVTHEINTSLIDPSTITSNITIGSDAVASASTSGVGQIAFSEGYGDTTIVMSSGINWAGIFQPTDVVIGAPTGGSTEFVYPTGSATVTLHGTSNAVTGVSPGPNFVFGYVPGSDKLAPFPNMSLVPTASLVSLYSPATGSPLNGSTINFTNHGNYIYVGAIGGTGAASDMAAAANLVYQAAGVTGENDTFYGQNGSDTIFWHWTNTGAHTVAASAMDGTMVLIGVTASHLTAADFHK